MKQSRFIKYTIHINIFRKIERTVSKPALNISNAILAYFAFKAPGNAQKDKGIISNFLYDFLVVHIDMLLLCYAIENIGKVGIKMVICVCFL